ncbi:MAG TPA: SBBP repeat-containing protein, partial [Blastocatellia bacterium]|nr:SBBP repeat-containing protein [Blastocatellia bacterium]
RGQADSKVKFLSRGSGYSLLLSPTEAVLTLVGVKRSHSQAKAGSKPHSNVMSMRLIGANRRSSMEGIDPLASRSNYLIGNDARNWRTAVPGYARVRHKEVYAGIDLIYRGDRRQLEYDFVLAPGTNPGIIDLAFEGTQKMRVDSDGDLVLTTPRGEIRHKKPFAYQETEGSRKEIASRFVIKGKHRVGFQIGRYDRLKSLVIDPVLNYSAYFGGDFTEGLAIAVDRAGNAYVAGDCDSTQFPTTPGAFQSTKQSGSENDEDAVVMKINAAGTAVLYSTYIGGKDDEEATGIAVDSEGNAFVTGFTYSQNFPTTPGAFQTEKKGTGNAFIAKLNDRGTSLIYSTYLGGSGYTEGNGIAVDSKGNAYVAGGTDARDFPATAGAFQTEQGSHNWEDDAFVAKVNPEGSALVYSTYLGGYDKDVAKGIAVDSDGNVYVTGLTDSGYYFPTTFQGYHTISGYEDVFVTKLNADGSGLIYSSRFGGGNDDVANSIAIDSTGAAIVTGSTSSLDFPTVNAVQDRLVSSMCLKSQDRGDEWGSLDAALAGVYSRYEGLEGTPVSALAVDPRSPSIIYAGLDYINRVVRSTDAGASWSGAPWYAPRLPNGVTVLAVDPQDSSTVYAGVGSASYQDGGLLKSTDSGTSFQPTGFTLTNADIFSIAIDPGTPSTLYVGTGLYQGYFAGGGKGILKSTDGGSTWTEMNNGLADLYVAALAIDPSTPSTIYAGTLKGLCKSIDGGNSWAKTKIAASVVALALDPFTPATIYATAPFSRASPDSDGRGNPRRRIHNFTLLEGIVKSTDGGASWKAINDGLDWQYLNYSLAIDPMTPSTVYVGTSYDGLFKTTDGGNRWNATGLRETNVGPLAVTATTPPAVFATTEQTTDAFVAKLDPSGRTLVYSTYLGGLNKDEGRGVAVDSSDNVYLAGLTRSAGFPVTAGALQSVYGGANQVYPGDSFVMKLDTAGKIVYSTFFGGSDEDGGFAIAVDSRGSVYITGETDSLDFPSVNSPDIAHGEYNCFMAKFSIAGSAPRITGASVRHKKLIVEGRDFSEDAVVMIDGQEQQTTSDPDSPTTRLIARKAGKQIARGQEVMLRVKNNDGSLSLEFGFARP